MRTTATPFYQVPYTKHTALPVHQRAFSQTAPASLGFSGASQSSNQAVFLFPLEPFLIAQRLSSIPEVKRELQGQLPEIKDNLWFLKHHNIDLSTLRSISLHQANDITRPENDDGFYMVVQCQQDPTINIPNTVKIYFSKYTEAHQQLNTLLKNPHTPKQDKDLSPFQQFINSAKTYFFESQPDTLRVHLSDYNLIRAHISDNRQNISTNPSIQRISGNTRKTDDHISGSGCLISYADIIAAQPKQHEGTWGVLIHTLDKSYFINKQSTQNKAQQNADEINQKAGAHNDPPPWYTKLAV